MNSSVPSSIGKRIFHFLLGCLSIYGFLFWISPAILKLTLSKAVFEQVQEEEIDAAALFYTDSPLTIQAEWHWKKHKRNKRPASN
ncbi:MAG: hypothetical protein AAFV95_12825 [Bacteroidota bacterium]